VIAFVWNFEIKPGRHDAFERLYGADGEWTALSRRSRSYLGSSFLRDLARPTRYLVVEYWSEMVVYERHTANFRDEIARLEKERELLLESSSPPAIFSALDVPDRAGPTWSRRSGRPAGEPPG
jgi:quinol monooxygenase YgiN